MQFCFEFNLNRNRQNKSLLRTFDNNKIFLPAGELVAIALLQPKLTFREVITIITSPWTNWDGHATLSPWWAHYFRPLTSWRTRQILLGKGDYILKFLSFLFCFIIRCSVQSIYCYLLGFVLFFSMQPKSMRLDWEIWKDWEHWFKSFSMDRTLELSIQYVKPLWMKQKPIVSFLDESQIKFHI